MIWLLPLFLLLWRSRLKGVPLQGGAPTEGMGGGSRIVKQLPPVTPPFPGKPRIDITALGAGAIRYASAWVCPLAFTVPHSLA